LLARKKGSPAGGADRWRRKGTRAILLSRSLTAFAYPCSSVCLKIRNLKTGFSAGIPCGARQNGNGLTGFAGVCSFQFAVISIFVIPAQAGIQLFLLILLPVSPLLDAMRKLFIFFLLPFFACPKER
jgi:hypothetical protein